MSEQEHKVLKEQRNRRKRVQHIRIGIITAISVWMILSIVITCILLRQGCITAKADQHPDRGLRFVHGSISQGQPECIGYGRYKTDPEYIRQRKFGDCRRSA